MNEYVISQPERRVGKRTTAAHRAVVPDLDERLTYFVVLDNTTMGVVSGASANAMRERGTEAAFIEVDPGKAQTLYDDTENLERTA